MFVKPKHDAEATGYLTMINYLVRWAVTGALSISLATACLAQTDGEQPVQPQPSDAVAILRTYPRNATLDRIIASFEARSMLPTETKWLVQVIALRGAEPEQAAHNFVSETGAVYYWNANYSGGDQGPFTDIERSMLTSMQLASLQTSLQALPPDERPADARNLLLLSFRLGETWITRLYDRAHLPPPVRDVVTLASLAETSRRTEELRQRISFPAGEARFEIAPLYQKVFELVHRYYPDVIVVPKGDGLHFEYNTQKFMVHNANMRGDWQEARPEIGPKRGGISGEIQIYRGQYRRQANMPLTQDVRYFTRYMMATESKKLNAYLWAQLKYPPDAPDNFRKELIELLNDFERYVTHNDH